MSGEELDQALASVLGSFRLSAERGRRQRWADTIAKAAKSGELTIERTADATDA